MHDLSITIVEEHTKRLSRNLALTQTRRRTITFQDPQEIEIQNPDSKTTIIKNSKQKSFTSTTTTERALRPAKDPVTSTVTTTTVAVPYKNFKIWTDYDREQNFLLHIKEQKDLKEQQRQMKSI